MSLWLSAANRVGNRGRGLMLAAARRQQAAASAAAAREVTGFWTRALRAASQRRERKG